jgi:signal transduction histidine kinase
MAALLAGQCRALELVASGAPLKEVLGYLVELAEEHTGFVTIASILLLDENGQLRVGAGSSLPDDYNAAIDGLVAREDLGTCSRAAIIGDIVVTSDIENDPYWSSIRHLPLALGLVAAWSRPILSRSGKVLGTFGTYFREKRCPTEHEQVVVEMLARTAGIAIERTRMEEERETWSARLESLVDRRTEDLMQSNERLQAFAYSVAHDLRQQIRGISINSALLLTDELDRLSGDGQAMMRRLNASAIQLGELVDDLLLYGKLDRSIPTKSKVNLSQIITENVAAIADEHVATGNVEVKIQPNVQAFGNPSLLNLALSNLLDNAVKYSSGVPLPRITFSCQDGTYCLEDNGIGFDMAYAKKIFEPFERLHGVSQYKGTGIGLASVQRVIEKHGGKVWAESSPGSGSRFYFTLA